MVVTVNISNWDTDKEIVRAMLGDASTGTGTPPIITPPPPTDTNVYPLTMPVITDGSPVTLGTGPDTIELRLSSQPNDTANCVLAVLLDGKAIAGPLTVSAHTGADAGQVFSIHGVFGPLPHTLSIVGAGTGLTNLWVNAVSFNFTPLVFNGPATYRGGAVNVNSTAIWMNNGANSDWTLPVPVVPPVVVPPVPVPAASEINGAAVNGVTFTSPVTLAEAIASTPASGVLTLPAAAIVGTAMISAEMIIKGAGIGATIINGKDLPPTFSKAGLVVTVPGVVIQALTVENQAIDGSSGGNACGVRDNDVGCDFTLIQVEITGCQDGILTSGSNVSLSNCHIHGNGAGNPGSGATHEIYANNNPDPAKPTTFHLVDTLIECGDLATHALKSRAAITIVDTTELKGNASGDGGANSGRVIDIPNGGSFAMTGGRVILPPNAAVTQFFGYGVDNQANPAGPVKFSGVVFEDDTNKGGSFQCFGAAVGIEFVNCTYTGTTSPRFIGWSTVTGTITPAVVTP